MRLGRRPADPTKLVIAPSLAAHRFAVAEPKPVLDRRAVNYQPIMGGNDTKPVCTVVGIMNAILAATAVRGWAPTLDPAKIDPFYARLAGCACTAAAIEATDGLNALDVLRAQVNGFDVGSQAPAVGIFGTLLPSNRGALANCMDELGSAYVGIDLYERDMEAAEGGLPWVELPGDPGPCVGGHLICLWDYLGLADDAMLRVATWGALQPATWGWLRSRIREAHGIAWREFGTAGALDGEGDAQEALVQSWVAS